MSWGSPGRGLSPIYASRAAASAAARSAGSSERTSSGSPVSGCVEPQLGRVQELALQAQLGAVPVDRVADDGGADRGQVHADLVGAPGLERHPQERAARQRLDQLELGERVAAGVGVERHPGRVAAVAADRRLDPAPARPRPPADEGDVRPPDPAAAQLRLQARMGAPVAGDEQEARRVAVEPVDDPGPGVVAACGHAAQRVDERRARVAGHRVDEQPGGLVDDDQVRVGVGQRHADALRRRGGRRRLRLRQAHDRPGAEPVRLRARLPVDEHEPGLDQALGARPRAHLVAAGDEAVEPHPAGIRRHLEVDHGRSSPADGSGSTGACALPCSTRSRPSASSPTPITMKLSARLNVGQWVMWMKSVT